MLLLVLLIFLGHIITDIYDKIYGYNSQEEIQIVSDILNLDTLSSYKSTHPILEKDIHKKLPHFNPNNVQIENLAQYGISDYAAQNLLKYRKAGGTIKNKTDLLKIYGMDFTTVSRIENHLVFPSEMNKETHQPLKDKKVQPTMDIEVTSKIKEQIIVANFNPNTASYETLISNGFSQYAAQNLIKYRDRGGQILQDSDLLKIYGFDTSYLATIIGKLEYSTSNEFSSKEKSLVKDSTHMIHKKPQAEHIIIDLSSTSQDQLIELKGIGPIISKGIIEYGQRLGGYYRKEQLLEVYAMTPELYESIKDRFIISRDIQKIYIPSLSFKEALKHPYIDYETTKRLKKISLLNYEQSLQQMIDEGTLEPKLIPYLHLKNPLVNEVKSKY